MDDENKIDETKQPVVSIDPETNKILAYYDTLGDASRTTKIARSCISDVCLGERNRETAGKLKWRHADSPDMIDEVQEFL